MPIFFAPMFAARPPLVGSASPSSLSKTINGGGMATTASAAVSVSGAVGALTYSWSVTNGAVAVSPTNPTTAFRREMENGESANCIATCTITDGTNSAVTTVQVSLSFQSTYVAPALSGQLFKDNSAYSGFPVTTWWYGPADPNTTTGFWAYNASNGSGSYTYTWTKLGGDTEDFINFNPSGGELAIGVTTAPGTDKVFNMRVRVDDIVLGLLLEEDFTLTFTHGAP